jgi:hypothetical protein
MPEPTPTNPVRVILTNLDKPGESFEFEVPPEKWSRQINVRWHSVRAPGSDQVPLQFDQRDPDKITLPNVIIAREDNAAIWPWLVRIDALTRPDPILKRPHRLQLDFGNDSWPCVLESYTEEHIMYDRNGFCIQARLNLTLKGLSDAAAQQL